MTKTFESVIKWNSEYVPFVESWELKECSCHESISGKAILTALNNWFSSKRGEQFSFAMYSFQAVCDTFNEDRRAQLVSVDLGENMIVHWNLEAEPYVVSVENGEEWYGVKFIATEMN